MLGKKAGFSMVEVIVVLVIIATISAGGMLIAGRNTDRAKFVRAQKDLDTIQQGFMQYYNVAGNYNEVNKEDNMNLDAAVKDTQLPRLNNAKANEVLQSFYGKSLNEWLDPWNNKYKIRSTHETTGKGMIIVYVSPANHSNTIAGPHGIGDTPMDVYTHPDGVAMYRIIYNVTY